MTKYEVRVTQKHVDFFHVEADSSESAQQQVLVGISSGLLPDLEYVRQSSFSFFSPNVCTNFLASSNDRYVFFFISFFSSCCL